MIFFQSPFYLLFIILAALFLNSASVDLRKNVLLALNLAVMVIVFFFRKEYGAKALVMVGLTYLFMRGVSGRGRTRVVYLLIGSATFTALAFLKPFSKSLLYFPSPGFLGLSFLLLRMIHLLADCAAGRIVPPPIHKLLNYAFFFPTFLSGPVMRFDTFSEDLERPRELTLERSFDSMYLVVRGVFRKFIIADLLGVLSLDQFHELDLRHFGFWQLTLASWVFTFVLYFDFAGYTDIARGASGLLGFRCPENFRRPLFATNLQQFWTRWHISFMEWIRDYLFFPLSKWITRHVVKSSQVATAVALWFAFAFAGLWHGLDTHFLLYGLHHALGITVAWMFRSVMDRAFGRECMTKWRSSRPGMAIGVFLTLEWVSLGWIFFLNKLVVLEIFLGILRS